MNPEMKKCVDECMSCHAICTETIDYCLRKGGKHAEATHIRTLMDCAESCITSVDFMLRGSELHTQTCATCAVVCDACAKSCESMQDDPTMKRCADVCRRCAEECRKMSGGVSPGKAA
jgi:hypothetical protein